MGAYPGTERERRIGVGSLSALVGAIFERCGLSPDDAALLAETLVVADLRGVHSEPPVVLDAAFSASAHGKIRIYLQKGLAIPEGWAFDRDGRPTTDAAAALEGLLQRLGLDPSPVR